MAILQWKKNRVDYKENCIFYTRNLYCQHLIPVFNINRLRLGMTNSINIYSNA